MFVAEYIFPVKVFVATNYSPTIKHLYATFEALAVVNVNVLKRITTVNVSRDFMVRVVALESIDNKILAEPSLSIDNPVAF